MRPIILTLQSRHRKKNPIPGTLAHLFPDCIILEVKNTHDAVATALVQPPDLFLMDMDLLRGKRNKVIQRPKSVLPGLSIFIVVKEENEIYRTDSATIGADAYVSEQDVVPLLERLIDSMGDRPGL